MAKFPPDIVVLDLDGLLHARLAPGKRGPRILQSRSYRLAADTFTPAVVTPVLANEQALTDAVRRLRLESGKWDRTSLLLPDSWFRINILDLPSLPDRKSDAVELVRWSLKKTLPIPPEQLRVAYEVLSRSSTSVKLFVLSALDSTLAGVERIFAAAGFEIVLIEALGLNIWNAIAAREADTAKDRLFLYVRDTDFTTAVFRGGQPLFIRSRNLGPERTLPRELRLSASYLRDTLQTSGFERCYLAGNAIDAEVESIIASEFDTKVHPMKLSELVEDAPVDAATHSSELAACAGVFAA